MSTSIDRNSFSATRRPGVADPEKNEENIHRSELKESDERLEDVKHDLKRGLKARHITMIAIGGAIGTGLIIGTCVNSPKI